MDTTVHAVWGVVGTERPLPDTRQVRPRRGLTPSVRLSVCGRQAAPRQPSCIRRYSDVPTLGRRGRWSLALSVVGAAIEWTRARPDPMMSEVRWRSALGVSHQRPGVRGCDVVCSGLVGGFPLVDQVLGQSTTLGVVDALVVQP